jgi:hypothetical protein
MNWTERYRQSHNNWCKAKGPGFYEASGGDSMKVPYPCVTKANGLTLAICKFLEWEGHRATRINVSGRLIDKQIPVQGGLLTIKKWQSSTTRRGTADISATIKGRAVMIEIKVGKDKPSVYQLAEQQKERDSGGVYEFIHTIQEFFEFYDMFLLSLK